MLERIMLDIMYDVPSREDIAEVTINRAVVEGRNSRSSGRSRTRTRRSAQPIRLRRCNVAIVKRYIGGAAASRREYIAAGRRHHWRRLKFRASSSGHADFRYQHRDRIVLGDVRDAHLSFIAQQILQLGLRIWSSEQSPMALPFKRRWRRFFRDVS